MIDRFHHLFIQPSSYDDSLAFYRDILGWTVTEDWGGKGEQRGAILSGGGIKVVLAQAAEPGTAKGESGGARPTVHLDIHDIDSRFHALPKGAHVVTEPEATRWGTRWFVVRDPDGNLIAFEELHGRRG